MFGPEALRVYEQCRIRGLVDLSVYRALPLSPDRGFNREVTARAMITRIHRELVSGMRMLP